MAKIYRTIKFTYDLTTYEIDILTERETSTLEDIYTIRQTLTGKRYKQITGTNIKAWNYSFPKIDENVFDFYNDAYEASVAGTSITLEREQDDGTFESYDVIVNRPSWQDDTISTTEKVYNDFAIEVLVT